MKVLNIGSMNIDFVYTVSHFLRPGETFHAAGLSVLCGGKGLNQSIALARAGMAVCHVGCVGEDGGMLVGELEANGVNVGCIRRVPDRTGHAIIQVDGDGQNCILLFGGANQCVSEEHIDAALDGADPGDIVLLQNETSNGAYALRRAKERGLTVVINPAPMSESMRAAPLRLADMIVLNEVEAEDLCGAKDAQEQLEQLHAHYPDSAIVLTLGERGSIYRDPDGAVTQQAAIPADVVDTTAAGDTYLAYLIAGLAEERGVSGSMEMAARAASIAISRKGAAMSIPFKDEVIFNM